MEVCQHNELFKGENGDLENGDFEFSCTMVILKKDGHYYYAFSKRRYRSDSEVDPLELGILPIPDSQFCPPFPANFTRAPEPLPQDCYVKRPCLINYATPESTTDLCPTVLEEAQTLEILRKHPHPNVVRYLGCLVENDRITGLCLVKYDLTLLDRVKHAARSLDGDNCLNGIRMGIEHLHGLGLIHCDINPSNIMMSQDDVPVIIDFDSCRREGEKLGLKGGTAFWTDESFDTARRENDYYGLQKIREMLMEQKALKDC